ncbi:hypothetical protein Nepgr_000925 [Nepenthes gracilis]|uniref:non-specific serine/threonine protein kinase n=1 Tax=Nepenthes gracilis TaxID=150966 RepID=A0AAD3P422_NEPGR|nr:hypothetical protein Nepgr_000925 [Nepenthes gracilis]
MSAIPSSPPKVLLLLFLFLLLNSIPFSVNSQSLDAERSILLNVKQQWGNPPALRGWNSTSSPCGWPGIQCSGNTVTGVSLSNYNITLEIPASICDLKNLTTLVLSWNYLPGGFPTSLYNCSELQVLDLSQNYFVGQIPNDIDNLSNLHYLDLTGNNFTGDIPKAVGQLKKLVVLKINQNLLNGTFPADIGNLSKLEDLELAYNGGLTPMKIPPEFGKLRMLKFLWIKESNLIGEIPESFGNLSSLQHLDLVGNNLVGAIPSGLFQLQNLTYLYLYRNSLSGEIPSSILAMNLTEIDLSNNNLTGSIPENFGKLQELQILNLFYNQLSGQIPTGLGLLPKLIDFSLFHNKLSGVLPPDLGLHSRLETVQVCNNQLSGSLPENLCAGGALLGVVAFSNNLSGEIPKSLANCSSMTTVELYNNGFSGEVPSGIWTLTNLTTLTLSSNVFSGNLPNTLAWNLSRLEIENNKFSGQIPTAIEHWSNLIVFKASNNGLSGTIPSELTSLSQLNTLNLDGNQFTGGIPLKIISWKSLITLNLARNQLSGSIPAEIGSLPDLNNLDLSDNDLSGEIPPELGFLKLTVLNLSSNKLTGDIPSSLDNAAYEHSFLNNSGLCSENQIASLPNCSSLKSSKTWSSKYLALILVLAVIAFLFTSCLTLYMMKEYWKGKQSGKLTTWKLIPFQRLDFTEANILSSLTDDNLIGSGGSGKVFRISINRSGEAVAVKKIWNNRKLDNAQFIAEVQILGTIRHSNIVKLLCCISSEESKLLVYEYMENESLDKWLHGIKRGSLMPSSMNNKSVHVLDWPSRMRIAIGAAQGLCYMHHDCSPPIIHRDVKSSNILLDSEFNAKIADFGLAKTSAKQGEPHTVSAVAGSFGYLAPEYGYMTKVNEKIDVYSFGVVLLELATGKEPNCINENLNLADWAWKYYSNGNSIADVLDEEIKVTCFLEEMSNVFKLGLMCTSTLPSSRPSMKEVLQVLRWCSSLEDCGGKKTGNEHDDAPLLCSGKHQSSHKKSTRTLEEDVYSMV